MNSEIDHTADKTLNFDESVDTFITTPILK